MGSVINLVETYQLARRVYETGMGMGNYLTIKSKQFLNEHLNEFH